jgi:hypothetical protein
VAQLFSLGSKTHDDIRHDCAMSRSSDENRSGRAAWGKWLLAILIIYLLPYVAVLIDEVILKTFWFSHHLSYEVVKVFSVFYYPLIKLYRLWWW